MLLDQTDKYYLPEYLKLAEKHNLKLKYRILKPSDSAEKYLQEMADENTYFLVTHNRQLANESRLASLVMSAYYQNIKLIGNRYQNLKTGTLASIYTSAAALASEAGKSFKQLCESDELPAPRFAKNFNVAINKQIAENTKMNRLSGSILTQQITDMESRQ